jgi:hypothetical protein
MSDAPKLPPDARPLRLVPGYCITDDGRVFNAKTGKPAIPFPLHEARRKATAAIEFDATRHGREPDCPKQRKRITALKQRLFELGFEPQQLESLVYLDSEEYGPENGPPEVREAKMVQWVRLPSKARRRPFSERPGCTVFHAEPTGGSMPAVGDTSKGWYQLEPDGALVLFHGPSLAVYENSR